MTAPTGPVRVWPHGGRSTFRGILNHHDAAGTDFVAIAAPRAGADPSRPLLVVIHPGDLIEPPPGWGDVPEAQVAFRFGHDNQVGTAVDMAAAERLGWDVAVIHRGSCTQFKPANRWVDARLGKALRRAWPRGWVAYGDDLDAAAAWLEEATQASRRPRLVYAGAYSTPGNGCVTIVAQRIATLAPHQDVAVSRHSPGGNGVSSTVWRPGRPEMTHAKARGLPDPFGNAGAVTRRRPVDTHAA